MSSKTADVNDLFNSTDLSKASMNVLTGALDIGARIQAGLGVAADDVMASEVVLVAMEPDDSGSIRFAGNAKAVRDGHNLVIDSLKATKQKDGILAHTRYLNGHVLYPYRKLDDVIRMDSKNYDPSLGTPLYDNTIILLGTVLAKSREFEDSGVPVRTITLIITDGADTSSHARARDVKHIVEDMLRRETHIIAGMGISDGGTDFMKVFREMGIRDEWILTPANKASDVRKAFQVFSQSAVRASQNSGSFSKTSLGGFGG